MALTTQYNVRILEGTELPDPATMSTALVLFHVLNTEQFYVLQSDNGVLSWVQVGGGGTAELFADLPLGGSGTELDPFILTEHSINPTYIEEHSIGPESITEHSLGPESIAEHSLGPESIAEHSLGPESIVEHSIGPESIVEHSIGAESLAPDAVDPTILTEGLRQELGLENVSFYVDSATGSDSNDGSQADPFLTLAHALSAGPACTKGEYFIYLIGAGPYELPTFVKGVQPIGENGQPLLIVGDTMTQVRTGTVSAVSGATVTVSGGGMVADAYRNLVYHGLTGASAGEYYTIATNSTTQLSSLYNTFGAAINDTFEILTPTTVINGDSTTDFNTGRIGFYACRLILGRTNVTNVSLLFDACLVELSNDMSVREMARLYSSPVSQSRDFLSITTEGTQSGGATAGAIILASDSKVEVFNKALAWGYIISSGPWLIDANGMMSAFGVDIDLTGSSWDYAIRVDHDSFLRGSSDYNRILGNGAACVGIDVVRNSGIDFGHGTITNCAIAAVRVRLEGAANLLDLAGSAGNGAGVTVDTGGRLGVGANMTLSGTAGNIVVDGSSRSITWAQAGSYVQSLIPYFYKITTRKTFASHTALTSSNQYVPLDSAGGAFAQNLALAATLIPGQTLLLKDETGNCSVNPVTVTCVGSDTFENGLTTFVIGADFGAVQLESDGTSVWYVVGRVLV